MNTDVKKPFYKRWYFWVICGLVVLVIYLFSVINEQKDIINADTARSGSNSISIVDITSSVYAGETASITVQGKPNTKYKISVYYDSGKSKADGLEPKTTGESGIVYWEWEVGGNTNPGEHRIVISGGWDKFTTYFETT